MATSTAIRHNLPGMIARIEGYAQICRSDITDQIQSGLLTVGSCDGCHLKKTHTLCAARENWLFDLSTFVPQHIIEHALFTMSEGSRTKRHQKYVPQLSLFPASYFYDHEQLPHGTLVAVFHLPLWPLSDHGQSQQQSVLSPDMSCLAFRPRPIQVFIGTVHR